MIKSAASAASLDPRKNPNNPRKNREKINEKVFFFAFYICSVGSVGDVRASAMAFELQHELTKVKHDIGWSSSCRSISSGILNSSKLTASSSTALS